MRKYSYLQQTCQRRVSKTEKILWNGAILHSRQVDLLKGVEADAVASRPREVCLLEEKVADGLGEELEGAKSHSNRVTVPITFRYSLDIADGLSKVLQGAKCHSNRGTVSIRFSF